MTTRHDAVFVLAIGPHVAALIHKEFPDEQLLDTARLVVDHAHSEGMSYAEILDQPAEACLRYQQSLPSAGGAPCSR